jgi:hypothetical protein
MGSRGDLLFWVQPWILAKSGLAHKLMHPTCGLQSTRMFVKSPLVAIGFGVLRIVSNPPLATGIEQRGRQKNAFAPEFQQFKTRSLAQ